MAMAINIRQVTDVPCTLIDLKNEETIKGYRSGRNWLLHGEGCHTDCCVAMYNDKVLNSIQTWLPGFSATYHYTTIGMASGEAQAPITEEYLIDTIKLLISDGVFDGTQEELLYWHVGFCLGVMSGKTIPMTEREN